LLGKDIVPNGTHFRDAPIARAGTIACRGSTTSDGDTGS
jgi:hypothetical protein